MRSDVWALYEVHLNYCKEHKPGFDAAWDALFGQVDAAITQLWSKNSTTAKKIEEFIFYFYCHRMKYRTEYANKFGDETVRVLPHSVFNQFICYFEGPQHIAPMTFLSATTYDVVTGAPASNSYLTTWLNEITHGDDYLDDNLTWLKNQDNQGHTPVIDLFEDRGELVAEITSEQIAREIYITNKLRELISLRSLDVYIPTGVRG